MAAMMKLGAKKTKNQLKQSIVQRQILSNLSDNRTNELRRTAELKAWFRVKRKLF